MPLILIALIVVPLAEIAVFIQVGGWIGLAPTLLTVVLTAVLGAVLLRRQGLQTVQEAQAKLNRQEPPIRELFDGVCLFAAGAFLLTPGFLTDAVGFALLVPPIRLWIARKLWHRLMASPHYRSGGQSGGQSGGSGAWWGGSGARNRDEADAGPVIDADFEEIHPQDRAATSDAAENDPLGTPPRERSRWGRRQFSDGTKGGDSTEN